MGINLQEIKSGLMIAKAILFLAAYLWIEFKTRLFREETIGN